MGYLRKIAENEFDKSLNKQVMGQPVQTFTKSSYGYITLTMFGAAWTDRLHICIGCMHGCVWCMNMTMAQWLLVGQMAEIQRIWSHTQIQRRHMKTDE